MFVANKKTIFIKDMILEGKSYAQIDRWSMEENCDYLPKFDRHSNNLF